MGSMTQESGAPDVEHVPLVLADDLRHDLERIAENVAHAIEPSLQYVTVELERIAWETERRAVRAAGDDAGTSRPPVVSAAELARHVMRVARTAEQRTWWHTNDGGRPCGGRFAAPYRTLAGDR